MSNTAVRKNHNKLILIIVSALFLLALLIIYFGVIRNQNTIHHAQPIKIDGVILTPPKQISEFKLFSTDGKNFTKDSLKGQWTMMFFGFTNCGLVCPTSLSALNRMYQRLQKQLPTDHLPHVVMVSVDPERDTIEKMKKYVTSFNPNFVGATGKMPDILALTKQLYVVAIKIQAEGQDKNNYSIDHSAEVLVFNPQGELQAYLSYPHQPEQMVKDYKSIITRASIKS